jgi:hypothetical protein
MDPKLKIAGRLRREAIRRRNVDGESVREIVRAYNVFAQHDFGAEP